MQSTGLIGAKSACKRTLNPSQRTRDGGGGAHHGRRQRNAQRTQEAGRREGRRWGGGERKGEDGTAAATYMKLRAVL